LVGCIPFGTAASKLICNTHCALSFAESVAVGLAMAAFPLSTAFTKHARHVRDDLKSFELTLIDDQQRISRAPQPNDYY
jgi:hypothetical protein